MIYMFKVICSKDYTSHSHSNSKGIPVPSFKETQTARSLCLSNHSKDKKRERKEKKIKLNCTSSFAVCETEEKDSRENPKVDCLLKVICKLISWQIR